MAWLWYAKTPGFPAVPIGVYDHPPVNPEDENIGSVRLAADMRDDTIIIGMTAQALIRTTRLNDWLHKKAFELLEGEL